MFNEYCLDSVFSPDLQLTLCFGNQSQKFAYANTDTYSYFQQGNLCVDAYHRPLRLLPCASIPSQLFRIAYMAESSIIIGLNKMCLAARAVVSTAMINPIHEYFYKPLSWDGSSYAILLMNHDFIPNNLVLSFQDVPGIIGSTCDIRDIWNRMDIGTFTLNYTVPRVSGHDAAFLTIMCY